MRSILENIPIPKGNKIAYKKGRIEKGFEEEVFSYLRRHDHMCYHVPDIGLGYRYLDGIVDCPDGTSFRIEFKVTDGYTLNMSQFEENQIRILEYFMKYGNEAYVMVYSKKTGTYWVGTYEYIKNNINARRGIDLFS